MREYRSFVLTINIMGCVTPRWHPSDTQSKTNETKRKYSGNTLKFGRDFFLQRLLLITFILKKKKNLRPQYSRCCCWVFYAPCPNGTGYAYTWHDGKTETKTKIVAWFTQLRAMNQLKKHHGKWNRIVLWAIMWLCNAHENVAVSLRKCCV